MPAKAQWYLQDCVYLHYYTGDITMYEIEQVTQHTLQLLEQLPPDRSIHILVHTQRMDSFPNNLVQLNFVTNKLFNHRQIKSVVSVVKSGVQGFLGNLLLQMARKPGRMVTSLSEALITLQKLDPTLPELPTDIPERADGQYFQPSLKIE